MIKIITNYEFTIAYTLPKRYRFVISKKYNYLFLEISSYCSNQMVNFSYYILQCLSCIYTGIC
ncbi:unnamed protein product [Schistosoma curassoni]|uniref:Uncharacterized protein n=1 Tax=Schistosoma curassoni TaxID=6186 RepID=A0A183JC26_9TREM|nr:unnamed protein product [Schistosoma curassoni]